MANKWTYMGGFCDLLLKHMAMGNSFKTFAATLKYPPDVVESWLETQPEFARHKKLGECMRLKALEDLLLSNQIKLDTYKHLTENQETEFDAAVDQFDDSVLIQARERFAK